MLSYSQAFHELKNKLQPLYDEREAAAIAHEVMQHITGLDKTQRLLQKETTFTTQQQQQFEQMCANLQKGMPLQYATETAWFMNREFYVNEHVLIPRPETEELVQWIVEKSKIKNQKSKILDVGAGSGCIAISLKMALPDTAVTGCDISKEALEVAKINADRLHADIALMQLDILDAATHNKLDSYDVIVSNPPYIPGKERDHMHANVKDWEPSSALFVPDDDPLVFYKAIAEFGKEHLNENGYIYCELDAAHATECEVLFEAEGYKNVEIRKDMHGNWRMLKCNV